MAHDDPPAGAADHAGAPRDGEPGTWHDLATNRPGVLARARAKELVRRAPIASLVSGLIGQRTAAGAFRVGAAGEVAVGRRLARLRAPRWHVLHSVPLDDGASDIDHVVIGPPGVFTLNTKHHPGGGVWVGARALLVNGEKTDYLWRARAEAARATRSLDAACGVPVGVRPVIVVVSRRLDVRQQPPGVNVVAAGSIVRWLRRQRPLLTPDEVATIFDVARRDSTWLERPRE